MENKRHNCILCGGSFFEKPLMICYNVPKSAQDIPDKTQIPGDKDITLRLYQCKYCGLVQFNTDAVWYYKDVIRAGGYSSTMHELRMEQYNRFINSCGLNGKKIIEAGCGRGEFLKMLEAFDVEAYGIEHSSENIRIAEANGLNVFRCFAKNEETNIPGAPYDAFLSFNFLEHLPDPNGYLKCIYNNLNYNAYGLITVPSLEYIIENDCFYELIHDHIAYYTENTLRYCLEKNGFCIQECERVNRDTISATVKKKQRMSVKNLIENRNKLRYKINSYIDNINEKGGKAAIWGASHQGFTVASTMGIEKKIAYIIDSAPFKQGRYAPASHIPIVAPDFFFKEPVAAIIIIAPGYTNEIKEIIRSKFGKDVKIAELRSNDLEMEHACHE